MVTISIVAHIEAIKRGLKVPRDSNLEGTTFEDKLDIIAKMRIKAYPSEDLKSVRVVCQPYLEQSQSGEQRGRLHAFKLQAEGERQPCTECGDF